MKIYSLSVLLPACRAGDEDTMLQTTATHKLEVMKPGCEPIPAGFLPQQQGHEGESECSKWLEDCVDSDMPLWIRKRWRHNFWKNSAPMSKERWLRPKDDEDEGNGGEGNNGVDLVQAAIQRCSPKICCGNNHRLVRDKRCVNQMNEKTTLDEDMLDHVYLKSVEHDTYPLAMVSRVTCAIVKDDIASTDVQLLSRGARLHGTVTEGEGDGKVGGWGSNVSLASLSTSPDNCTMPCNTHPEGWDCNCHVLMRDRCKAVIGSEDFDLDDCYKAHICNRENVCQSWIDDSCSGDAEFERLQALLLAHPGLLQKQGDVIEEATGLEGSLQSKTCI